MPKVIYNYEQFLKGLAPFSELVGGFADCRDIDPHRSPGYIRPGSDNTNRVSSDGTALAGLILDAKWDPGSSSNVYAVGGNKLYQITGFGSTFTSTGGWPHTATGAKEVVFFDCKEGGTSAKKLFYIMDTDMGMSNPGTPDWDDTWLSGTTAGGTSLTSGPHPKLIWKSYLWIGNGRYLVKVDGQTGNEGVADMTDLDLGIGWEITSIFPTPNYIGVCAWKKMEASQFRTECKVFFYDGSSDDWTYFVPIGANKVISSYNNGGEIYLTTTGSGILVDALERLTNSGSELIQLLKFNMEGSTRLFRVLYPNTLDIFQNRLMIGASEASHYRNALFAYGSTNPQFPKVLTQPYSSIDAPSGGSGVGFVGHLRFGFLFTSYFDGSNYYWVQHIGGNSTNAYWKGAYTDIGQRIKVNYVKFYFKPLVTSDSITVSLDTNYGTANTLGTITEAADGTTTSKIFRKPFTCHAFRPAIDWTAGGVAFSKVVVDFSYISD